jgi:chromosome segregation ATPase
MQKQLEKEAEEDEAIYDKMACWCTTNDKEKTQAIKEAEVRIEQLTATIEEKTALSAKLTAEIKNLEKEVAANQASLDKATALRAKELAEFNAEEKDLLQSIGALKSAITVLSKHHSSFVQAEESQTGLTVNVAAVLKHAFKKHREVLLEVITPSQHNKVEQFIQDALSHTQAPSAGSYANQSGEIFGILKQMLETFESNLSQSQKDEMAAQSAFEDLKAAKEAEIAAGQAQIDSKTQELADTDEKNAQAKEDVADTKKSLAADEEFLMMLKEKCSMTDSEWEERQKTRQLEMEAVSKALAVLSTDDAHDLFTKTFNPSLL